MTTKSKKIRGKSTSQIITKSFAYLFLIIFALIIVLPFIFALATSFADKDYIFSKKFNWYNIFDGELWDKGKFSLENYKYVLEMKDNDGNLAMLVGLRNTIAYIIPPVFVGVISSAMGAYSLSRINFKGRNLVFSVLLCTMVIPGVLTMVPGYVMFAKFYKWADSPLPLIIPGMCGGVMTMFFIRQFFLAFPKELEEAAFIDGMGRIGIFIKIALPLAKPVIITQIILSLNGCYNDYLNPLLYVGTISKYRTLQLNIASISTARNDQYTRQLAASLLSLIPTFLMFVFAQKYFVSGLVVTGIKG